MELVNTGIAGGPSMILSDVDRPVLIGRSVQGRTAGVDTLAAARRVLRDARRERIIE